MAATEAAAHKSTGYDSKLSKSMHANVGGGSVTSAAPSRTSQADEVMIVSKAERITGAEGDPRVRVESSMAQAGDEDSAADGAYGNM